MVYFIMQLYSSVKQNLQLGRLSATETEWDALETDWGRVGVPELDAPETVLGPPETAGGVPKTEWEKHRDLHPEDLIPEGPRVEKVL